MSLKVQRGSLLTGLVKLVGVLGVALAVSMNFGWTADAEGVSQAPEDCVQEDARQIDFDGREWNVKTGFHGPGGNCWSNSQDSVWVGGGYLHLKIRPIEGVWHTAEVFTTECVPYGKYYFHTIGRIDQIDPNVVLGLFLYADDNREIDIEFSRWGNPAVTENGQYVVQPYTTAGNLEPFEIALNGTHATHSIDWQADAIHFQSFHGHYRELPTPGHLIHEWAYTGGDIPAEADCLKLHINLWLFGSDAPSDGEEVEVVIRDLDALYLPLVVTPAPTVTVTAAGDQAWGTVTPDSYCNPAYKIVLYAGTDRWYIQPFIDSPDIPIDADCTWRSFTHPWNEVAAHLVLADYVAQPRLPLWPCPPLDPQSNADVLAAACYP